MTEINHESQPIYTENYSHLTEIVERSQHFLPRIKDAIIANSEIGIPLNVGAGDTLLDIGCGVGRPGHYLRYRGVNTINADINLAAHQASRRLWGSKNYNNHQIVADGSLSLPFKDDSIDGICTQDFFEHIPPESIVTALEEMSRVLRSDRMVHRITVTEEPNNLYADKTHQTFWSAQQWRDWFASQGWKTIAPTTRRTYAPHAKKLGFVPYCYGYFLIERTEPTG